MIQKTNAALSLILSFFIFSASIISIVGSASQHVGIIKNIENEYEEFSIELTIIPKEFVYNTIKTELGQVKGKIQSLEGDVTTIKTDIGTIAVQTSSIRSDVGLQPVAIGLSLIAALAAIAASALILRKVYLK